MSRKKAISLHGLGVYLGKLKALFATKEEVIMFDENFVHEETLFVNGTIEGDTLYIPNGRIVGDTLYLD